MQVLLGEVEETVEVAASLDKDSSSNRTTKTLCLLFEKSLWRAAFLKQAPDQDLPGLKEADNRVCVCVRARGKGKDFLVTWRVGGWCRFRPRGHMGATAGGRIPADPLLGVNVMTCVALYCFLSQQEHFIFQGGRAS